MRRTERIIIYASKENKKRWERTFPDFETKNYEEALMLLLDLYESVAAYFGEKRLKELVEKMRALKGVRLKVVG